MSNKDFYRAFEDKYRGSKELIKNRIKIYLPFILKFKELYPDSFALDIGCGRGEWLELLKENGISAQGVDLDKGMLEACYELGLNVLQDNGVEFLKKQKDNSITIISAFHVVEHISFEDLQVLVKESLRVLKPGGILILETPNPENIKVSTEYFYLDPTHTKPIPSNLLSFLPEFNGYIRTKVLGLQESKEPANQNVSSLMQVLEGVSPDYAVIAQKKPKLIY
ncbi:class I SAM-dependent methyltransferase [Psychromonas sp. KJ10-10]|uniref:class I SAM-dependent methyltransferase n=1 Tax=Psychromonas sp. KJ10-10 TaxID=3391823 RepID=UPI0039B3EB35